MPEPDSDEDDSVATADLWALEMTDDPLDEVSTWLEDVWTACEGPDTSAVNRDEVPGDYHLQEAWLASATPSGSKASCMPA